MIPSLVSENRRRPEGLESEGWDHRRPGGVVGLGVFADRAAQVHQRTIAPDSGHRLQVQQDDGADRIPGVAIHPAKEDHQGRILKEGDVHGFETRNVHPGWKEVGPIRLQAPEGRPALQRTSTHVIVFDVW